MPNDTYAQILSRARAPCAHCEAVLGLERECGITLVVCTLAPLIEPRIHGRVAILKALKCPGPNTSTDARIAYLAPPPDS